MGTTVSLRKLVPGLYARSDASGDWTAFLNALEGAINLILSGGLDQSTHVDLTSISIDAMADVRDPTIAPAILLAYIGQAAGFELDPDLAEQLQRKILTLVVPLYREKGTKPGIVSALRLLLGLDVDYRDLWGDGFTLGRDVLGGPACLGANQFAPAFSRGTLVGCDPATLSEHAVLSCAAWGVTFEIQKSGTAGTGDRAFGFLTAPSPALLANNLNLVLPAPASTFLTLEFQVDDSYVASAGAQAIDVRTAVTATDVAAAIVATITALHGAALLTVTAAASGAVVKLRQDAIGAAGDIPITGSALELLNAIGLSGGAAAVAYAAAGGNTPINLIGAVTFNDVAARVAYAIAFSVPTVAVTFYLAKIAIRAITKGAAGDGTIGGAVATEMSATGMAGGAKGINRAVLTFRVAFPRNLSDDELRAAIAVIDFAKRSETHYTLVNPPNPDLPLLQLGTTHLDGAYLSRYAPRDYQYPTGDYADDEFAEYLGRTWCVNLGVFGGPAVLTPRLIVGAKYLVQADDDVFIRQGNKQVVALTSDMPLGLGDRVWIVTAQTSSYLSALRAANAWSAFLRVTRVEGPT